ncbi:MAG: two-component sensor histidine kinase [Leptolyngbya foveolarum]|uniref:histidine kinase n=1 Tax=Leptolyngbya foveolarum TaxID=47253 RepID=A0A2W4UKZ1_9CYAN|nr:MAG: two-component sensor histidine kinase [Leptolyngbya foveolarum]
MKSSMKFSRLRFGKVSDKFLMPILTVAVICSLILVAIGSFNTSTVSKNFRYGITTDFRLQQLNSQITYYDEVLTMSARMAASTGNLDWKQRYDANEPLLTESIEQATELAPTAYAPYAVQIDEANLKLIEMETKAFNLVNKGQLEQALEVLFGGSYQVQKEIYSSGLKQWSDLLNEQVSTNLNKYSDELALSSLFSVISFCLLTISWVALLVLVSWYVRRRKVAEKRLRQANRQIQMSHEDLQMSESALQQKAVALEKTLAELQQAQVQIVQSEKMSSLGQLVAGVAHEINNPVNFIHANLNPIGEYSDSLLALISSYQAHYPNPIATIEEELETADIDFIKEDLPKILNSMRVGTARIRQIVLSLRNFSRSDEQGLKSVDVHEGLESTLLILQHRIKESPDSLAITVERDYGDLPQVDCYPGQLNQVFMNLLANAIDALDEAAEADKGDKKDRCKRGTITIRTSVFREANADWVEISIADDGLGMSPAVQSRIFDAFYTTKPVGKGTGMGLSISHTVVTKKHEGKLFCKSSPGQGCEFIIQIPRVADANAPCTGKCI